MNSILIVKEELQRLKEGDPRALRRFIDRYGEFVMTVMRNVLDDENDVQECFWKLMEELPKRLARFEISRPLMPYLWKIAKHDALRKLKDTKRLSLIAGGATSIYSFEMNIVQDEMTIEETLIHNEKIAILISIIQSFGPDKDVSAFFAACFDGFTYTELAEVYGIPETNARNRVSRGKAKIIAEGIRMYPEYFPKRL